MRNLSKNFFLITLPIFFSVGFAAQAQVSIPETNIVKRQQQIQREVLQALPKARYLDSLYIGQKLIAQVYPRYFFSGTTASLKKSFNITENLALDTTSTYIAIYVRHKLRLVSSVHTRPYYGFYPVDPPIATKNKGMGSRDSSDYDIKLVKAAARQTEAGFFFSFSYLETALMAPSVIGFFKEGKLHFINTALSRNGKLEFLTGEPKVYDSFKALVIARYGSKKLFFEDMERQQELLKHLVENEKYYKHTP